MTEPGWYQDPASRQMTRWWDGQRWTSDVRPGPGVAGWFGHDLTAEMERVRKAGRNASTAVIAGAVAYSALYIVNAVTVHPLWSAFRRFLDTPVARDGTAPTLVLPHGYMAYNLVLQVVNLAVIAIGILFVMWFHQAATIAQRSGLPARHTPAWAVLGWIIPIVNFWFPYQSAVDLFPPGHPARRKVGRWWALWLASSAGGILVVLAAIASVALGLAVALLAAALSFAAAFAAREVIAEFDRVTAGVGAGR